MGNSKTIKSIVNRAKNKKSSVIVGPSDGGKTWFIENELISALGKEGLKICYVKDCLKDNKVDNNSDIIIADEFETLADKDYLEKIHPKEIPYYNNEYINKVHKCHDAFNDVKVPIVFVITRNETKDINYIIDNLKNIDSGQEVQTYYFNRNKN